MKRLLPLCLAAAVLSAAGETKIGLIGLDTGHVTRFTKFINVDRDPAAAGFRVTAAYQWGSRDIFSSTNRYPKFIRDVSEMGVKIVPTIDELIDSVDCICLETNDGREHLWQAEKVFKAGKRVFIDKPLAHRYLEAEKICELAKKYNASFFSASALRFVAVAKAAREGAYGPIASASIISPDPVEEQGTHNDYAWYGIHGFDPLVAIMGTGVEKVCCQRNASNDAISAVWRDGRMAQLFLQRGGDWHAGYILPAKPKDDKRPLVIFDDYKGYQPLLREILAFFRTGVAPVSPEETLEVMAFMEAAQLSARRGGVPVTLAEACARARAPRETVVFVEAHPDDLASHAGTAILMAEKFDVRVLDFTRGENGIGEKEFRDGSCARLRVQEERNACKFLGTEPVFLDEVNYKGAMAYAGEKTTRRMAALFAEWKPRAVILHWPLDTHPDHVQSTAAALHALRLANLTPEVYFHQQPVQSRNFTPRYSVDVSRVKERKDALVRCYACQDGEELCRQMTHDSVFRARRVGFTTTVAEHMEPFAVWDGSVRQGKSVFFELDAQVY